MKKLLTTIMLVTMAYGASAQLKLNADNIEQIIDEMTLEEKCHLVVGTSFLSDEETRGVVGYTRSIVPGAAGTTFPIERLGIPAIVFADGPQGLRISPTRKGTDHKFYCTGMPIGMLMSSTWNEALIEKVGAAVGEEVLEYNVDVILGPGANLMRNPLCGRNFEYYSEDPVLSGKSAAAMIRGVQSKGVGTSMKHYAVNNQEINRLSNDSRVDIRTLRELYLRNFQIAIQEAQPWTIMTSYNFVNGRYTSEDAGLCDSILRKEWGFRGAIVSDWGGGVNVVKQMQAGNDMLQPGFTRLFTSLMEGVESGALKESDLDACCRRILQLVVRSPKFRGYKFSNDPNFQQHAEVALEAATEGLVLLKNDNKALPIATDKCVALFGTTSYKFIPGGTGSGEVNMINIIGLYDAMKCNYKLEPTVDAIYAEHMAREKERLDPINSKRLWCVPKFMEAQVPNPVEMARNAAAVADVAIITIGRNSGEGYDRHIKDDYMLRADEIELIEAVSEEFHRVGKKVTVLLNVCGLVDVTSWRDKVDAILMCWLPGQQGGTAIVDVVSGRVSPSGHLPATMPMSYADVKAQTFPENIYVDDSNASFYRYNDKEKMYVEPNIDYTNYYEGIYVGYRDYATNNIPVAYPFGHGLTYSSFALDKAKARIVGDSLVVTCRVRNVGDFAAKQVVQLYSSQAAPSMPKPAIELRGYAKSNELQPGESQRLTITLPLTYLASYDDAGSQWVVDADTYTLHLGFSSEDIKCSTKVKIGKAMYQPTTNVMRPEIPYGGQVFIEKPTNQRFPLF